MELSSKKTAQSETENSKTGASKTAISDKTKKRKKIAEKKFAVSSKKIFVGKRGGWLGRGGGGALIASPFCFRSLSASFHRSPLLFSAFDHFYPPNRNLFANCL